ncbi:MAG: chromosome segregation protein SMC [Clostridiales bacterium]|nr:chromosome segregation protein SMC [Candidatus Equinaster intestinalis]
MLLSSIQIQGFKSFADKTTLKFGKGITGIVGPNGSGKSNISDAVRWVLGEQSTKNLRGQSMEDVIFGGTASRRPHGYCEVTLNIDNTDRSLNFDDDFVAITRRYYRSHESEYLINNVSVRLKDINELFMDTGLGRDGYSMVGQGKIDAIISTKSNERRDIFEEASGISKYRYRKLESERKLAAADENLLRLKDIMAELESRVGPLKIQSEKAERFLSLAEQKKELEIGLWLYSLDNFKEALRLHENKITACKVLYGEIEEKLSEFDSEVEKNASLYNEYTVAIEEKRQNIAAYGEQIAVLGGNIQVTENDILHNDTAIEKICGEIESLKNSEESARAEINSNIALSENAEKEIAELENQVSAAQESLNSLLTDSETFSRKIEQLSASLNELSVESANLRVTVLTSETAAGELKQRETALDELIAAKKAEITGLETELSETDELIASTLSTITDCENSLKGYEMRLNTRKEKSDKLRAELDTLRLDIEAKKRRVQILEDLEKNMEGFNFSVKSVMQTAESGLLRGVHGPVASIINTKKEFTVAIETALGGALQNIVVDTDADAKRCINHLKKNNAGRATFLSVADIKARPFKEKGYENAFGYVGIAADLVETDKKYREIIEYLLGAVVVAEDLDAAVSIAKKFGYAFKVVSLDGQVVNSGGSMTGGSLIKNAGLLTRKEDIKKLNSDIEKMSEKEKNLSAEYDKSVEDLSKVEADILTARDLLKTANEDNIRAESEKKRIEELMSAGKELCDSYENEKTSGGEKYKELLEAKQTAEKSMQETDLKKQQLQSEIDSLTGGRDELSAKREEITEAITALKLRVIEKTKDKEGYLIAAQGLENALNHRDERVAELEKEKADLQMLNESKRSDISAVNGTVQAIREQIAAAEKEIEEITLKRSETEKSSTLLRATEKDKTLEREKLGGELARLTERKENMLAEFDNVIKQLYDEYNLTRGEAEALGIKIENPGEAKKELSSVKSSIKNLGTVNVSAIEEYKEVSERYTFMSEQIADVEASRAELNKLINQLTGQMQEMFTVGFARINECFSKTFTELFGGGTASLVLTEPDNVLESGIDIIAKLPGKNVPSLDGLSGGEKALVALSIYFAIMFVNAPPFCFLDEVDTALDDINVERFAQYMKKSEVATQFICVTHRRGTMEAADMLYGVTMQEKGVTKLLELNVAELEKKLTEVEK